MEKTIKSIAINFGLYLGATLGGITVLAYALYLDLLTKWWLGILLFVIIIVYGIISVSKSKASLDGYISFKESFSSYFITVAIGVIISTLVSVLVFNFIDPEAAVALKEKTIEATLQIMKNFNAPEEEIAKTLDLMEAQKNQFALMPQIQSTAMFLVIQAVIGLIVSLIMKKTNEDL
ncbi:MULTISPECIES: DUF4199 domain-containing protein [unclassified Olleya]|jgi:fumarate reductase subunit C|uniref:DUF4199 domain-containing protein n=1 Tax=unclassified Olleya TaxID=2615019 RepID=UPI0011A52687|nr:DUF4199 domain-containing protein [Olleya sp. Hel_I_94]TVZ47014.1 uncharacterized protein DUF4199 [Olleya sp. Hel_I_94]